MLQIINFYITYFVLIRSHRKIVNYLNYFYTLDLICYTLSLLYYIIFYLYIQLNLILKLFQN